MAADPTGRISHIQDMHRGLTWKPACRAATTASITISTALNNGDTLDGVTLATGDRVLVKDQSSAAQNGIYIVGATPTRAADMDQDTTTTTIPAEEIAGAVVFVISGTTNTKTIWYTTNAVGGTVGSTSIVWAQFTGSGGSGSITASGYTMTTARLLGRTTASTGAVEEITVGSGLTLSAGNLSASGGGGGMVQSYLGYNTIGGTWTTVTTQKYYNKKFTLSTSAFVMSVDVYLRPSTDNLAGAAVAITNDNSNAPGVLVGGSSTASTSGAGALYLSNSAAMPGAGRWVSFPVGAYLPAADYWAGFASSAAFFDIANDASGSDQVFTMGGGNFLLSGAYPSAWAITNSTLKYSIRVSILS